MLLFFFIVLSVLYGQVVLTNPEIPEKETIIYTQDIEGKLETVISLIKYKSSKNKSWLEYRFYSSERDVHVRMDESNLNAFYSEVWDKPDNSSFHSITEVLEMGNRLVKMNCLLLIWMVLL